MKPNYIDNVLKWGEHGKITIISYNQSNTEETYSCQKYFESHFNHNHTKEIERIPIQIESLQIPAPNISNNELLMKKLRKLVNN